MNAWLRSFPASVPSDLSSPADIARFELDHTLPGEKVTLVDMPSLGEGYQIRRESDMWTVSGGSSGLLYGVYTLIQMLLSGEDVPDQRKPKGMTRTKLFPFS